MKNINTSLAVPNVRGFKIGSEMIAHIISGYLEGFEAILKMLNVDPAKVTILQGAVVTQDGDDYSVTAGWAAYGGEIFKVDSQNLNVAEGQVAVWSITTTYLTTDPVPFSDGNEFSINEIRKLVIISGASGSGLADHGDTENLADKINDLLDIQAKIDALVDAAPGALDTLNELAAALGDDPNFATTVTNNLALKATKAQTAWTTASLINGWTNPDANKPLQYFRDEFGRVHLRGRVLGSAATFQAIFSLPAGFRPGGAGATNVSEQRAVAAINAGTYSTRYLTIASSNGSIQASGAYDDGTELILDGISFDTRDY